jgi:glucokinase
LDLRYIAVDIGATKIRVCSGDSGGIFRKISEETDRNHGKMGIPKQIIRILRELEPNPKAIGIGSIGPIDLETGTITNTPNYPFNDIPIMEPLRRDFNVPVGILNDCAAAVSGEHTFGAGKDKKNLFYVTFSTGLGGGAIVDGHLLLGKDGNAPEIGHLVIDPRSELVCGCGGRGHWEAYSSGTSIPKFAKILLREKGFNQKMISGEKLTAKSIFQAAKKGNKIASYIVDRIGEINAIGMADIINAFDPELITIGGSVALNNPDLLIKPIIEGVNEHIINRKPEITITPLGEDIVLHGALSLALELER